MHDSSSWTVISFSAEGEKFYNQEDAKGGGGGGGDWFAQGQNPKYDSARFTKVCNIKEIQRFAKIPQTARD